VKSFGASGEDSRWFGHGNG